VASPGRGRKSCSSTRSALPVPALDFAFTVTVDPGLSNTAIFAMNLSRFVGYTTDVGYVDGSGEIAPNSVSRGPFGGGIGFNFNTRASVLGPG